MTECRIGWEVDVEVRVRKTLVFPALMTEESARSAATMLISSTTMPVWGDGNLSSFLKWSDGRSAFRPMPVETIIGNDVTIVAVRKIPE